MLYLETSGSFAPWAGEPIAEVQHPLSIERIWSTAELAAVGLFAPAPADPVPDDKISTGQTVQRVNGLVKFVHTLKDKPQPTKAERKEALKARVRAHGMTIRRGGFEVNFGTDEQPNIQVLQLRDATPENDDEKNWMASLSAYTAAVIGGAGDVHGAKFRPESNATIMVTYGQGMAVLTGLFDWVASLVQTVWEKCDQIDGADTHAELDALEAEIEQGWPE
ncbi:hypothetical protein [Devosia sp. 1635]|uniref:hypothetical protein n=1 Tax=Devosia sp. 1635 TaxID=2726066 RepID=UPI0015637D1C|nr:hypothetical protein [Devosia sp. 1635]